MSPSSTETVVSFSVGPPTQASSGKTLTPPTAVEAAALLILLNLCFPHVYSWSQATVWWVKMHQSEAATLFCTEQGKTYFAHTCTAFPSFIAAAAFWFWLLIEADVLKARSLPFKHWSGAGQPCVQATHSVNISLPAAEHLPSTSSLCVVWPGFLLFF